MKTVVIATAALAVGLTLGLATIAVAGGIPWRDGGTQTAMMGSGDYATGQACEQMADHMGKGVAEGSDGDGATQDASSPCPHGDEHHVSMMNGMMGSGGAEEHESHHPTAVP